MFESFIIIKCLSNLELKILKVLIKKKHANN